MYVYIFTDGAYKTKEHINTVENTKSAKTEKDPTQSRKELEKGIKSQ